MGALEEYERVIVLASRIRDPDMATRALEGMNAVLHSSPELGRVRFEQLTQQFAALGVPRLEGLCRYWRARCLERIVPRPLRECAAEYQRAAEILEESGSSQETGDAYYSAAMCLSHLSMTQPQYCEPSFALYTRAAQQLSVAGNRWGEGLAEFGAARVLRLGSETDLDAKRRISMYRRSLRSFARARRSREEAGSRLALSIELGFAGNLNACIRSAVLALRSYERARWEILLPHERDRAHKHTSLALSVLTGKVLQAARSRRHDPWWTGLVWRLEETSKGRSFQDQRFQNDVWNLLLVRDAELRRLTQEVERHQIDSGGLATSPAHQQAERRLTRYVEGASRQFPDFLYLASSPLATVAEVHRCLMPGEAYLGFLWEVGSVARVLLESDGTCSVTALDSEDVRALNEWLDGLQGQGRFPRDHDGATSVEIKGNIDSRMAEALLGQIPDGLTTLIISPHGRLVGIPWHKLPVFSDGESGSTLGDCYNLALVPSAGTLLQLRTEKRLRPDAEYFGVACDGDGRIPGVDVEVENVAKHYFGFEYETNHLTTRDCHRLFERRHNVRLLHLACHAGPGGLLLLPGNHWMTPVDLLELGLKAEILLLTGCSTGGFSAQDQNEYFGVVRQLLMVTRARAAVVSVDPVPDVAGIVFSDLFVSALTNRDAGRSWRAPGRPLAVGQAVRWARAQLRGLSPIDIEPLVPTNSSAALKPRRPTWWSPWLVIGDPSVVFA